MLPNKLCRVRRFGLPLYDAIANEGLAERLGLLLFWTSYDLCQF